MPLQDSDNFIIGRGTDSYKITYQDLKDDLNYVPPPTGTINTPTVLEPNDGAGGGDTTYLKGDAITDVEDVGGGQTKLTLAGSTDLALMTGSVLMTDGTGAPGPYSQTPYKLTTTDIESVDDSDPANVVLTFAGDVSGNSDLQYFLPGDVVKEGLSVASEVTVDGWLRPNDCINGAATRAGNLTNATGGTISFNPPLPGVTKVIAQTRVSATTSTFSVNGNVLLTDVPNQGDAELLTVYNGAPINLTSYNQIIVLPSNGASSEDFRSLRVTFADGENVEIICTNITTPIGGDVNKATGDFAYESTSMIQSTVVSVDVADNEMVVDGGNWATANQGYGIWTGTFNSSFPGSKAFDGLYATGSDCCIPANINDPCTWTGEINIPNGATVKMVYRNQNDGAADAYFRINNQDIAVGTTGTGNDVATIDITAAAGSQITKMEINRGKISTGGMGIGAILINDSAVTGDSYTDNTPATGDTKVEYETLGGQGTIIETNTGDNTLLIADTGSRDNRWIAENKATIDFCVAGPEKIDKPLLTNDVQLRGSDFATTPPGTDTLKEIIWSINDVEYSAGVTNPWKPLNNLPTNSTVTVKVKYKGNTLEDSDWSPSVTFTTGATLRSLFTRIAALEAGELIDDATDTALLTLLSNLAIRVQALEESN